jgi:2-dehydro-3-deoxygluconokinase
MSALRIRSPDSCGYDLVALGEVMLRLDPGECRVRNARQFKVWEGGGEYNVARGLRSCFGLRTGVVTALVSNDIGRLIEDLMLQGGVDTSLVRWKADDGVGRTVRNALNFTERGFGIRGAVGVSDRGNSAASQLVPGEIDWDHLFSAIGVRWLHTGGIFAALSETSLAVAEEAITAAARHGTIVSYDLNYRPSLWKATGGIARARAVNRRLARHVDVMIGNEGQLATCFGTEVPEDDPDAIRSDGSALAAVVEYARAEYPNLHTIAATIRTAHTATVNDWGAIAWSEDAGFVHAKRRDGLEILDRVGGGDGFAAGLIYGILEEDDLALAIEYGAAHGALAMTTPGDSSAATFTEVQSLVTGSAVHAQR